MDSTVASDWREWQSDAAVRRSMAFPAIATVPDAGRILVVSLAGIGDTLIATPFIHELRANFPDAAIDALVLWAGSKDLLEGNPHLNAVLQKNLIKEGVWKSLPFLRELRERRYDISINVHTLGRIHYRAVARFIGARLRLSHEYEGHGWLDHLLVNRTIPQDYAVHSVENNNRLLPLLGTFNSLLSCILLAEKKKKKKKSVF